MDYLSKLFHVFLMVFFILSFNAFAETQDDRAMLNSIVEND